MALAFSRKTWKNKAQSVVGVDPAIEAAELNRIETGILDAVNEILAIEAGGSGGASVGVGAPSTLGLGSTYYELNSSGVIVAIWIGTAGAPSKVMDVLTGGTITPLGEWNNVTAYGLDAVVSRNGSSYLSVAASTGIDPTTDDGTHWMLLAAKGDQGIQGIQGIPGNVGLSDGVVLSRYLADLARPAISGWMIGTGFAQNYRRETAAGTVSLVSRQLCSSGGLVLPGGRAVTGLRLFSGSTALVTPVHQFVALYDGRTGALLAAGQDVTVQAWPANTQQLFPISYTPTTAIEARVVYYCEATTMPTLAGLASISPGSVAPAFGGLHDTLAAGSGPAALPAVLGAVGIGKGPFWVQAE